MGLDTPAAALNILRAMQVEGYPLAPLPDTGTELIQQLLGGVTNDLDSIDQRPCHQSMALEEYLAAFNELPQENRDAVNARWGTPDTDPMFRSGRMMIAGLRFGLTFIGIQPARGYQVDLSAVYHDPDLVPPWLSGVLLLAAQAYGAHAVVHVGKHGNLEWLPGRAWGCRKPAGRTRCWAPCRTSIRSSSTTRARAHRPNGALRLSSSIT